MAIIPKEILLLLHVCYLINQAKEKEVSEKCISIAEISKDAIIKKEIDEKIDAYKKQLRCK